MFVEQATWEKLIEGAKPIDIAGERILLPRPEYLVALKLHAVASPTRSKEAIDWEDIRQIVRLCALDPGEESFRALILRYGDADAFEKIESFAREAIICRAICISRFSISRSSSPGR